MSKIVLRINVQVFYLQILKGLLRLKSMGSAPTTLDCDANMAMIHSIGVGIPSTPG